MTEVPAPRSRPVALADAPTSPSGSQAVPPGLKRAQSGPPGIAPAVAPVVAPVVAPGIAPAVAPAVAPAAPPRAPELPAVTPPAAAPAHVPHVPFGAGVPPLATKPAVARAPEPAPEDAPLLDGELVADTAPTPPPAPAPAALPVAPPARPVFASSQPEPHAPGPRFGLAVLAGPSRGQRFKLASAGAQVGRNRGVILFPDDPFVSPQHATFLVREGKLVVRDDASTSGCYVSIAGQETVPPGAMFCTGIRLFRYVGAIAQPPPASPGKVLIYGAPMPPTQEHYAVEEILLGGRAGRTIVTAGPILTIGLGKCDLAFPNDDGLAQRHCELSPMPTGAMIRDLSGGLGTFVRVQGERVLKAGDRVRIGQQTLQVEVLG